jgi:serine/threonine protein kinase
MTELTVGRVVQGLQARYTVERALGAGGFGMTYLARRGDGEAVVLKQLRLARMTDWKALELFEREARVLAALSHPGIPKLYEFFALDGESPRAPAALYSSVAGPSPAAPPSPSLSLVIAQAYVDGRSLQAWIDAGGRWTADDAEAVLRRLLDVLKYLHTLNPPVIHRDIKPANVVLGDGRQARTWSTSGRSRIGCAAPPRRARRRSAASGSSRRSSCSARRGRRRTCMRWA